MITRMQFSIITSTSGVHSLHVEERDLWTDDSVACYGHTASDLGRVVELIAEDLANWR
jgi:hypothetical protein